MYPASQGQYYFRFKSDQGGKVLDSIPFHSKSECQKALLHMKTNVLVDTYYEKHLADQGKYWFGFKDAQGHVIACSEKYSSAHALDIAISLLKTQVSKAPSLDLT